MKNAKAWENADNQFTINLLDMHLIGCLARENVDNQLVLVFYLIL